MCPSTNQSGSGAEYDTKQDRFIESSIDIVPLLRGASTESERREWCSAMNRADREFPTSHYEILLGE